MKGSNPGANDGITFDSIAVAGGKYISKVMPMPKTWNIVASFYPPPFDSLYYLVQNLGQKPGDAAYAIPGMAGVRRSLAYPRGIIGK